MDKSVQKKLKSHNNEEMKVANGIGQKIIQIPYYLLGQLSSAM